MLTGAAGQLSGAGGHDFGERSRLQLPPRIGVALIDKPSAELVDVRWGLRNSGSWRVRRCRFGH